MIVNLHLPMNLSVILITIANTLRCYVLYRYKRLNFVKKRYLAYKETDLEKDTIKYSNLEHNYGQWF